MKRPLPLPLSLNLFLFSLATALTAAPKPNIILIMADDMGFSDLGCFGSEIETPVLDRLADNGLRMSQFYNAARCCPSRASILTGQHPHSAGIGLMTDQSIAIPSYQGYLRDNVVTIPQLLKQAGYDTYTSGKWHIGEEPTQWPHNYGFDKCFSLIGGAASYFDDEPYRNDEWPWEGEVFYVRDDKRVEYPDGHYSTDVYTDYALNYIERSLERQKPFFIYLGYQAPHWPLHALPEDIAKYNGRYDVGWEVIRRQRYERQLEMQLFPREYELSPPNERVRDWESLSAEEQRKMADEMEVYAAMVDRMDQNIGRIVTRLHDAGQLDNTLIVFLSDNGGANAPGVPYLHERFDPQNAVMGSPQSFDAYGPSWANVSNTPFREYKARLHEGGISSPFVVHYPDRIEGGQISHAAGHITDILSTCIDLAGVRYPRVFEGEFIQPTPGRSLLPLFRGEDWDRQASFGFEHSGRRAFIDGDFKLVSLEDGNWELYNLAEDRTEVNNLIESAAPEFIQDMMFRYHQWARQVGAFPRNVVEAKTSIPE